MRQRGGMRWPMMTGSRAQSTWGWTGSSGYCPQAQQVGGCGGAGGLSVYCTHTHLHWNGYRQCGSQKWLARRPCRAPQSAASQAHLPCPNLLHFASNSCPPCLPGLLCSALPACPAVEREKLEAADVRGRRRGGDESDPDYEAVSPSWRAEGSTAAADWPTGTAADRLTSAAAGRQPVGAETHLLPEQLPTILAVMYGLALHLALACCSCLQFEYRPRAPQARRPFGRMLPDGLSPTPTPLAGAAGVHPWDLAAGAEASLADSGSAHPHRYLSLPHTRPLGPVS